MAKCINCGEELTDGAKFCMFCGSRQDGPAPETEVAAQADRVAELIENAPLAEETAAEPAAEPIPAAPPAEEKPAEPAPLSNEERSARLREQPSLEDMAASAPANPAPAYSAPVYTAPRPAQQEPAPQQYAYPAYDTPREQSSASGSYEPRPAQPRSLPKEDPEKPASKSKWQIMSTWGTFGAMLLMCIPAIGFILTIIWACGGCRKYAKRNLARAVLLGLVLCLILSVAAALVLRFVFPDVLVRAFEFFNPGYTIEF